MIDFPVVSAGDDILATDFNNLRKDIVRNAGDFGGTTGGTANAQTLSIDPAVISGDIIDGFKVRFKAGHTTTSSNPTLNVNATGDFVLRGKYGSLFPVNGLVIDGYYEAVRETISGIPYWIIVNNELDNDDVMECVLEEDISAGHLVQVCPYLSQDIPHILKNSERSFSASLGDHSYVRTLGTSTTNTFLVITYSSQRFYGRVATVDDVAGTITLGTPTMITGSDTSRSQSQTVEVSNNRYSFIYINYNSNLRHRIITVSGTTVSVSVEGSNASNVNNFHLIKIATNKIALTYSFSTSSTVILTVATLTAGSYTFGSSSDLGDNFTNSRLAYLADDKFIVLAVTLVGGVDLTLRHSIITVSGVTTTLATSSTVLGTGSDSVNIISAVPHQNEVVAYSYGFGGGGGALGLLQVSGTTLTVGGSRSAPTNSSSIQFYDMDLFYMYDSSAREYQFWEASIGLDFKVKYLSETTPLLEYIGGKKYRFLASGSNLICAAVVGSNLLYGRLVESGSRGDTKKVRFNNPVQTHGADTLYAGQAMSISDNMNVNLGAGSLVNTTDQNTTWKQSRNSILAITKNKYIFNS